MLLRLSRLSFWIAAAVAAVALLAPAGRETLLTAVCGLACVAALLLWRAGLRQERRRPSGELAEVERPALDERALTEAAALVARRAQEADTFEAALHAVAQVLRGELGAQAAAVHEVTALEPAAARVRELIEAQPGFRTIERSLRLDAAPLAQAIATGREAGSAPGAAALPVLRDGRVVAALALHGIELPVEPGALAGLLSLARNALSDRAEACAREGAGSGIGPGAAASALPVPDAEVLVIEGPLAPPEGAARMLQGLGCRVRVACGLPDGLIALRETQFDLVLVDVRVSAGGGAEVLQQIRQEGRAASGSMSPGRPPVVALVAPGGPQEGNRYRELGFDDHLATPFRQSRMLAMLNTPLRAHAPAAPLDASAPPPASVELTDGTGAAALDPAAIERLVQLDPKGENRLLERVLQAFQSSAARLRAQLDAARAADDRPAIRLVAHTLKSSSASIGAMRLSRLCAQVEAAIRLETGEDLAPGLAALTAALDGALQAIAVLLKGRS